MLIISYDSYVDAILIKLYIIKIIIALVDVVTYRSDKLVLIRMAIFVIKKLN